MKPPDDERGETALVVLLLLAAILFAMLRASEGCGGTYPGIRGYDAGHLDSGAP